MADFDAGRARPSLRVLFALTLALAVVLAGCGSVSSGGGAGAGDAGGSDGGDAGSASGGDAGSDGGGDAAEPTGDAASGDESASAETASFPAPPGIAGGRLRNATVLAAAHAETLTWTGFVAVQRNDVRTHNADPSNATYRTVTTAASGLAVFHRREGRTNGSARWPTYERWANASAAVRRVVDDGDVGYDPAPLTRDAGTLTGATAIASHLQRGRYAVNGTTRVNGTTLLVLTADEYVPKPGERIEADELGYRGRVLVDADGVVHRVNVTVRRVERNKWGTHVVERTFSYRLADAGGVRVPRPDWLAAASEDGAI